MLVSFYKKVFDFFLPSFPILMREAPNVSFPLHELYTESAKICYEGTTSVKRTRHPSVDLSTRKVVIGLHQTGVTRSKASFAKRAKYTTAHSTIGPTGIRYRLHPWNTRLTAINRFDRLPWHAISIEVGGNFEETDGVGNWMQPDKNGRGRATEEQLAACRQEIREIVEIGQSLGWDVMGIIPHRIAGRNNAGIPNKPFCPGSRVWSECGEWAGAELGLAVPQDGSSLGGTPIPLDWHGPYWGACKNYLSL